jgi:hypothetical protein
MGHELAGGLARWGQVEAVNGVVEASLEENEHDVTADTLAALGLGHDTSELLLEQTVDTLDLLLLTKLYGVLAGLRAPSTWTMVSRAVRTLLHTLDGLRVQSNLLTT